MASSSGVERCYSGRPAGEVTVREGGEQRPLRVYPDRSRQSEVIFAWGNDGAGAQQLARSLLADALDDDTRASQLHTEFTIRVISNLPARWTITRTRILQYVNIMEYEKRVRRYIYPRDSLEFSGVSQAAAGF